MRPIIAATGGIARRPLFGRHDGEAPSRWQRARRVGGRVSATTAKSILALVVVLIAARIALPYVVEHVLNDRLSHMQGYRGRVEDVDISLIRGAYRLEGIRIVKTGGDAPVPFFRAPRVDVSIEWRQVLHGKIVAEIVMDRPELNVVTEGREAQTGEENDWRDTVDDMVPLTINRLQIRNGEVHYRDFTREPRVDFVVDRMQLLARGLSNRRQRGERLPASLHVDARVQGSGRLVADSRIDPWAEDPTFTLALRLRDLPATEINDLLRAYAGVDAEEGTVFLYSEIVARDGRFRGYVKPMVEGLSLFHFDEEGGFFDKLGDAIVQLVAEIFENHGTDRLAVRVPVSGTFESPEYSSWGVVVSALSNAFVRAIQHGLDDRSGWERVDEEGETERERADRERGGAREQSEQDRGDDERDDGHRERPREELGEPGEAP